MESLLTLMTEWSKGSLLEKRAVVATVCEPRLLVKREHALPIIDLLDVITESLAEQSHRRSEEFRVLRKALAYGWSVAVAAHPELGKPKLEEWIRSDDSDVRWIMRQNLKKKRLAKMDDDWVRRQMSILEG